MIRRFLDRRGPKQPEEEPNPEPKFRKGQVIYFSYKYRGATYHYTKGRVTQNCYPSDSFVHVEISKTSELYQEFENYFRGHRNLMVSVSRVNQV